MDKLLKSVQKARINELGKVAACQYEKFEQNNGKA